MAEQIEKPLIPTDAEAYRGYINQKIDFHLVHNAYSGSPKQTLAHIRGNVLTSQLLHEESGRISEDLVSLAVAEVNKRNLRPGFKVVLYRNESDMLTMKVVIVTDD